MTPISKSTHTEAKRPSFPLIDVRKNGCISALYIFVLVSRQDAQYGRAQDTSLRYNLRGVIRCILSRQSDWMQWRQAIVFCSYQEKQLNGDWLSSNTVRQTEHYSNNSSFEKCAY